VGLDPLCPSLDEVLRSIGLGGLASKQPRDAGGWNPLQVFGSDSSIGWCFVLTRLAGSTLVVPPFEEVFYRSFAYRFVVRSDFESVPLRQFDARAFLAVCVVFGLAHQEWLAGILCGAAYQGLVLRHGRLGDAMVAHAITNCLLGLWVIGLDQWHFW
jgi:CAAX prenyl protease-like protein